MMKLPNKSYCTAPVARFFISQFPRRAFQTAYSSSNGGCEYR
nr:MAG TPA: hypothetical protein [Caudoviricetes sp.]